ncbi:hypothetical protein Tco_0842772 [Tanacetum coccineum]|uniref:Uncharacterized protein n=1 Tax=Tanacetum coccineum TaxID=301880 RepID=A0ABQ5B067_9ASTR
MTLEIHNWSSSAHQEIHKIVKDEIFSIVNQVDARVQNFEIQFLKEAAKFVRDFQSLAKEADESLAKHKALELEIERLLRAVVSQDIMSIMQNNSVGNTSNLQTELEHMKELTSNSAPSSRESTVVNNERVIAPGIFRINPFKASRVDNFVPKKVGSKERLASPKPSTHKSCLRWSPTGRMFDLKGNIIATSESVCQSDCSKGSHNWFDTLLIPLLSKYKSIDKKIMEIMNVTSDELSTMVCY